MGSLQVLVHTLIHWWKLSFVIFLFLCFLIFIFLLEFTFLVFLDPSIVTPEARESL